MSGIASYKIGGGFTKREKQVAVLISGGLINKEIADKLGVSVKTIEAFRWNLSKRHGLKGVAMITRHCLKEGWTQL